MEKKDITPGKPVAVTGNSREDVMRQLNELRETAKAEGMTTKGGFINYHQGEPGEPDSFDATITFNKK
jgi:hypothetical protein